LIPKRRQGIATTRCAITQKNAVLRFYPLQGFAMTQAIIRRPLVLRLWVPSQISPCETCSGQSGTVTGVVPALLFPLSALFHQRSTLVMCMLLLPEGQRAKPGNPESNAVAEFGGHLIETYFHVFVKIKITSLPPSCS